MPTEMVAWILASGSALVQLLISIALLLYTPFYSTPPSTLHPLSQKTLTICL